MTVTNHHCLGIDFGGVIVSSSDDNSKEDPWFADNNSRAYLAEEPIRGAVESIRDLVVAFDNRVHIISKASRQMETRARDWLHRHQFYEATGLLPENVRFFRERRGKLVVCREHRITHFIDNRIDIIQMLIDEVGQLYLFGPQKENTPPSGTWHRVAGWSEALSVIRNSL